MNKIYIIDGNSIIYRMFYAIPDMETKKWQKVNAVFWLAKFFLWMIEKDKPDHFIFVRDAKWTNFRHDLYKEYKSTRERMPDDLVSQIDLIQDLIKRMGIMHLSEEWYEADDVIATLVSDLRDRDGNVIYVLTGDKDLFSLIWKNVFVYDTMKRKVFWEKETQEKFWVPPERVVDYLSITGDKSDNVPWIPWFGPKKACELIEKYGSLEEIYNHVEDETWKTKEKLIDNKDNAFLSKELITLKNAISIKDFSLEKSIISKDNINESVSELFRELEFFSLVWEEKKEMKTFKDLKVKVKIIDSNKQLTKLASLITKYKEVVIDTETTSLSPSEAELVGLSIYLDKKNVYYVNVLHQWDKVTPDDLIWFLNDLLASDMLIIGHNLKYDLQVIERFLEGGESKKKEWVQLQLL